MWNDNNPVAYSDPSGYDTLGQEKEEAGNLEEIEERAKIVTYAEVERVAIGQQIAKQAGIPNTWTETTNVKTGVVTYTDPASKGATQVRIMPGNATSRWPSQRLPYVRRTFNGQSVDKDGNIVPRQSEESHITIKDFNFEQSDPKKTFIQNMRLQGPSPIRNPNGN